VHGQRTGPHQHANAHRLAANGLIYTQWHTTALCSPLHSTILTGRNHQLNGTAAITEAADGFLGASSRIPDQAATVNPGANHAPHQAPKEYMDIKRWTTATGKVTVTEEA